MDRYSEKAISSHVERQVPHEKAEKGYTLLPTLIGMVVILFLVGQSILFAESRHEVGNVIRCTSNTSLLASGVAKERVKQLCEEVEAHHGALLSQLWNYCRKEPVDVDGRVVIQGEKLSLLGRAITYMLLVERYTVPNNLGSGPAFAMEALPEYDYVYQSEYLGEGQMSRVDTTLVFKQTAIVNSSNPEDQEMARLTDYRVVKQALQNILTAVENTDVTQSPSIGVLQLPELVPHFKKLEEALERRNQCMVYTQVMNWVKGTNAQGNREDMIYDQCRVYTPIKLVGNEGVSIQIKKGVIFPSDWLVKGVISYQKEERKP